MSKRCSFPEKDKLTKAEAMARAATLNRRPGFRKVHYYVCPAGGHSHVGHRIGHKRRQS